MHGIRTTVLGKLGGNLLPDSDEFSKIVVDMYRVCTMFWVSRNWSIFTRFVLQYPGVCQWPALFSLSSHGSSLHCQPGSRNAKGDYCYLRMVFAYHVLLSYIYLILTPPGVAPSGPHGLGEFPNCKWAWTDNGITSACHGNQWYRNAISVCYRFYVLCVVIERYIIFESQYYIFNSQSPSCIECRQVSNTRLLSLTLHNNSNSCVKSNFLVPAQPRSRQVSLSGVCIGDCLFSYKHYYVL